MKGEQISCDAPGSTYPIENYLEFKFSEGGMEFWCRKGEDKKTKKKNPSNFLVCSAMEEKDKI